MAAVKALQQWCRLRCEGYRDVSITNMTTSFRDGLAFCALIHKHRPDLIDFDSLKKENVYENNKLAFRVAEEELGIPALLDAEDMVALKVPDRLSILTYVSQYYNYFHGRSPIGGMGGIKRPADGPTEEPPGKKNQAVTSKVFPSSKPARENSPPPSSKITRPSPSPKQTRHATQEEKSHQTGTLSNKCVVCNKHVHLVQRHLVDGKLYHRSCAKLLSPTNTTAPFRDLSANTPVSKFTPLPDSTKTITNTPTYTPSRLGPTWLTEKPSTPPSSYRTPSPSRPASSLSPAAKESPTSSASKPAASRTTFESAFTTTTSSNTRPTPAPRTSTTAAKTLQSKLKFFQSDKSASDDEKKTTITNIDLNKKTTTTNTDLNKKTTTTNIDLNKKTTTTNTDLNKKTTTTNIDLNKKTTTTNIDLNKKTTTPNIDLNKKTTTTNIDLNKKTTTVNFDLNKKTPTANIDVNKGSNVTGKAQQAAAGQPVTVVVNLSGVGGKEANVSLNTGVEKAKASGGAGGDSGKVGETSKTKASAAAFISKKLAEENNNDNSKPSWTTVALKKTDKPSQVETPKKEPEGVRGRVKLRADPSLLADLQTPDTPCPAPTPASRTGLRARTPDRGASKPSGASPNTSASENESPADWRSMLKPVSKPAGPSQSSPNPWTNGRSQASEASVRPSPTSLLPSPSISVTPPATIGSLNGQGDQTANGTKSESKIPKTKPDYIMKEDIIKELQEIEDNLNELEKRGVELEVKLRSSEEEGEDDSVMDGLMVEWFNLIRNKQVAMRRESELVYIGRTQDLEEQQPSVEQELRRLMEKPERLKTSWDRKREEQLIAKLLEIVNDRNAIIEGLDEDRLREEEEDEELNKMMKTFNIKKDKPKKKSPMSKLFGWGNKKEG